MKTETPLQNNTEEDRFPHIMMQQKLKLETGNMELQVKNN